LAERRSEVEVEVGSGFMAGGLRDDMAGLGLELELGAPWGGRCECAQWLTLFVVAPTPSG
jgi:hypothetical protein